MAFMTRARAYALAGATSLALVLPLSPAGPAATAVAAPVAATVATTTAPSSVTAAVVAEERKKKSSRSSRSFAVRAQKVMRTGNSLKGVPYRRGGTTPRGFDCSGFTRYVFKKVGVSLPHSATAQMRKARRISRSQARPGDLVFFRSGGGRAYHVGIYAGGNKVLHSPRPGERVKTVRIWSRNVSFGRAL
jgi:cell wall-associated NlpC family hydrolase